MFRRLGPRLPRLAAAASIGAAISAMVKTATSAPAAPAGLFGERSTVVLFGDSITQHGFEDGGWAGTVADYFSRRADVFNRGFGGYNMRWARHLLPSLFPESDRHLLVTVWFGANDAAASGEIAHVPLAEYEENMRAVLQHLKQRARHVVVLTPPPVHGPTRLAFQRRKFGDRASGVLERTTESAGRYAAAAVRVAAEQGVPVLDVHSLMLAEPGWPAFVGGRPCRPRTAPVLE